MYGKPISLLASLGLALVVAGGCQSSVGYIEQYERPAEINMAGRQTVVLDFTGEGSAAIAARLKAALQAKGYTIVDRGSGLARRRVEEQLGQLGEARSRDTGKITSAQVQIRGNVLRHQFNQRVDTDTWTDRNTGQTYVSYQAIGSALVEVSFDVTDLDTATVITSVPIASQSPEFKTEPAAYPPTADPTIAFMSCYETVINEFMKKVASFSQAARHELFKVDKVPANAAGLALMEASQPAKAIVEFQAAIAYARTLPKVDPNAIGRITHNLAVAYESARQFEQAVARYTEAARLQGSPSEGPNIARCQQRIAEIGRLKDQGIAPKQGTIGKEKTQWP